MNRTTIESGLVIFLLFFGTAFIDSVRPYACGNDAHLRRPRAHVRPMRLASPIEEEPEAVPMPSDEKNVDISVDD